MKKFLYKCFLFSIPFILYLALIALIDPFNYLNHQSLIDIKKKDKISNEVQPHLYKLISFQNHPKKNIILGDSRSNSLYKYLEKRSDSWANLSYGGGSIKEMTETFWWLTEHTKADTVLIGINLNLYNKFNKRFWVEETIARMSNFFSYAFSKYAFQATIYLIRASIFKEEIALGKPEQTREKFWQFQLNQTAQKFYEQYGYPDSYHEELEKIAAHCREHNIKLIFWIPPTFIDFQNRANDFGLQDDNLRFVADLKAMADLYDFDYDFDLTHEKELFSDPMHFKEEIGNIVLDEILEGKIKYARFSKYEDESITNYE